MFANFDVTPSFLFTVLLACNKLQPSKTQACQPSPCQYGGTCFNNNLCQCPPGLTGPICTNVDCDNYPCLNGGTCSRGLIQNQDTCQCPDGFVLPFCTTSCTSCFNGGTCSNGVCSCDSGSVGPTCQNSFFAYVNPVAVTVNEGNNDHDVTVQVCRQPTNTEILLGVYTLPRSASSSSDYENIPFYQDVTIPVGQVCTTETVTIGADQMFEQTEEFSFVLWIPESLQKFVYTLSGNTQTTITIMNDDPVNCDLDRPCLNGGTCRPSVLQNPCTCPAGFVEPFCTTTIAVYLSPLEVSVTEGNVGDDISIQIHVCRQPSTLSRTFTVVTRPYTAIASSDFVFINTAVTIPGGQVCAPVDKSIVSDMTYEPTEVFHLVILTTLFPSSVHIVPGQGTATVTIIDNDEDTDPPVITNCPDDFSRSVAQGTSSTSVSWTSPTAFDNSGDGTLTSSHHPGETFPVGQTTVIYTATDGTGNTVVCQFVVTVIIDIDECSIGNHTCDVMTSECMNTLGFYRCDCRTGYIGESYFHGQQPTCQADVTPPVISGCPSDIFNTVEIGTTGMTVSWTELNATDNSGTATLDSQSHSPGSSFLVGRTTVTYRYADPAGNEAVCTFDIIIQEDCIRLESAGQCSPNECFCTKGTCTPQTGRCEATCSIFQCPANIASVSLSQVNPQSSVEIKCILEGSTAVVNRLEIRLSRSEGAIDDRGIAQETAAGISANRIEVTYRVISVSEDDKFFCILSFVASLIGSINVTGFVYKLPSISDPPTEVTRTTTSVTITWRPWDEETDVGDPLVVAYIPYYKMDPSQDWMSGSRIQADQTLEYTASSLETDRNYTFSVAAVREGEGGEGPRGPAVTIKTLCIKVVPQMVTTTLTATNDVTVTWQQPTVQCSTGITQFTIYYEIEGDVSSRLEAGTADPNAETFTVDGSLLEPGTTYNIAVTVITDQESALSERSSVTTTNSTLNLDRMNNNPASEPRSSPVYLVALVIPVLLIIILLVVLIKRIRRKPASESKPVDVQDVDYVNAGVTDDPGDYIALEEQSKNTPAPKYQDLTEKEAPTQVSGYERTTLETADAAPKAMPRQGLKRQTNYQYEDVNLGETDARKLPSVPQPDPQSEDDTEYEVPEMFEEYTRVHINTLGSSKPITPRPMKITEYKTFMGRERSKVISEIAQQYTALKTGQQHPWTEAVKLQNKSKNFFKALLP